MLFPKFEVLLPDFTSTRFFFAPGCLRLSEMGHGPCEYQNIFVANRDEFRVILPPLLPDHTSDKVGFSKNFIAYLASITDLVVIDGDHDYTVLPEKVSCQAQARINHFEPVRM